MNLIYKDSMKEDLHISRMKNPYRFRVRNDQRGQNILSWFYDLAEPLFARGTVDEDQSGAGFVVYRKESVNTMEWEIKQSAHTLLIHDLVIVARSLTPPPLRRLFRDVRNYVVIFMTTDDLSIEEAVQSLPPEDQGRVILMQQKVERLQNSSLRLLIKSSKNVIHFSDAMRMIMLRSIHRIRKLPALFPFLHLRPDMAGKLKKRAARYLSPLFGLVKKISCMIINKRN